MKKIFRKFNGKLVITILLLVFCVILGILVLIYLLNRDTTPPEISLETESVQLTETEVSEVLEKDYSCLLSGVTASDKEDGDLSGNVIVYSVNIYENNSYAIANYRVLDSSNNMAVKQRLVYLKTPAQIYNDVLAAVGSEAANIINEELNGDNTGNEDESGKPVIEIENAVNLQLGESFDLQQYLVTLEDDKDSYETLLQNCRMEGEYNLNSPGVYPLAFYVTDSDGNESAPAVLILTVNINETIE
ncbi:hypothetical protein B5E64_16260 [Drancourtella sp. An12]|uniref:hypothetical protein n=1 Tax=Drancourtella sp. An12 TaxID=1965548 RepID=UPI000B36EB41|nr:hypothetical protein [Drancourtella sp. An12]OUQ42433.1 hypothetical protein B5E64_16260 [Drancourtella sp. An12]